MLRVPILLLVALVGAFGCREKKRERAVVAAPDSSAARGPGSRPAAGVNLASLPLQPGLPEVLRLQSGQQVRDAATWARRRREIIKLVQRYQYGRMPPAPGNIEARELWREEVFDGSASKRLLTLRMGPQRRVRLSLGLYLPTNVKGRLPVIVHVDHRKVFGISAARELVRRGFVVAGYDPTYLDPDQKQAVGAAQAAYPTYDWGTIAVWAWGAMRVLDYLLTLPQVDPKRVVITGHSRSGKTALWAGALDPRFALVAPMGSGCGGAATYRLRGPRCETLAQLTHNFPHWFHPRLRAFAGAPQRLPFDQHMVLALVAPRALLSLDALGDLWANPRGTREAHRAARPVFELLGAQQRMEIHFRPGKHDLTDGDWRTLAEFCQQQLPGQPR